MANTFGKKLSRAETKRQIKGESGPKRLDAMMPDIPGKALAVAKTSFQGIAKSIRGGAGKSFKNKISGYSTAKLEDVASKVGNKARMSPKGARKLAVAEQEISKREPYLSRVHTREYGIKSRPAVRKEANKAITNLQSELRSRGHEVSRQEADKLRTGIGVRPKSFGDMRKGRITPAKGH